MTYSEPAKRLIEAAENRVATTALTDSDANLNVASAYDIQAEVVQARLDRGHVVVGAKLGLTSVAKQKQMVNLYACQKKERKKTKEKKRDSTLLLANTK